MFTDEFQAIKRTAAKLTKMADKKIVHIIAFGSRVRGDFSEESDMDVLVTVHKKEPWIVSLINDLFYREEIKQESLFQSQFYQWNLSIKTNNIKPDFIKI